MDTSLSISTDRISLVRGKAKERSAAIAAYASVGLQPGTLINGIVMDEPAFESAMDALRHKAGIGAFKTVRLAIGTNQMFVKRAIAPKMPDRRLLEWVEGEFSDLRDEADPLVYDYEVLRDLGKDKGWEALLAAARVKLIKDYEERFKALKIRISSITSTQCALKNLVALLPETRDKTGILVLFDGNILDATLFIKGIYRYNSRARIFAERGSDESFEEVIRTISTMIQFNLSERSGESITEVYFAGVEPREERLYPRLETAFSVKARTLDAAGGTIRLSDSAFRLSDYAVAVGNLVRR